MSARHNILLSLLAICCCTSQARGDELYRRFLSLVDTNKLMAVMSPLLVDTNNAAPKLANSVVNLIDVSARGEIAGVRLGMTMEEVAASWGKPRFLWSRCFGGPRFCYNDVSVIFDPSSNSVMRVIVEKLPLLHGKLSDSSTADQFVAVLGKAVTRKEQPKYERLDLIYESSRSVLDLEFYEGRLFVIRLEQKAARIGQK